MKIVNKFKSRKGFTLIEIIVCIALIAIIGTATTVGIAKVLDDNKAAKLEKITSNLENALEVYLASNEEVEENLMLSTKAAVVTLDVLKNEGLIEDNLVNPVTNQKFDYENSFFTLLEGEVNSTDEQIDASSVDCNLDVVGIKVIASWDLSKYDANNVIYICPRKDYTAEIADLKTSVDDVASDLENLKEQVNNMSVGGNGDGSDTKNQLKINTLFDELTYTAKGANPNNWVVFDVNSDSSKVAYFKDLDDNEEDLWRIVTVNSDDELQLLYPNPVLSNNSLNYTNESSTWCDSGIKDYTNCTFYKLIHNFSGSSSSRYYRYSNETGWMAEEAMEDVTVNGSKKEALYNSIVNKNWIVPFSYSPTYSVNDSSGAITLNSSSTKSLYMGMININEINSSINISDSWLFDYTMLLGYGIRYGDINDKEYNIYNNAGTLSRNLTKTMANRCTNSQCTKDKDSSKHIYLNVDNYYPVVVLNKKVQLVEPSCPDGVVKGSKKCPYKLSCTNC